MADAAARAVEFVGLPEAQLNLAQAVVHLATAPKSNAVALGIWTAREDVRTGPGGEVPLHLRDAHYQGAKSTRPRRRATSTPTTTPRAGWTRQYLPPELGDRRYYRPTTHGREARVRDELAGRRGEPSDVAGGGAAS